MFKSLHQQILQSCLSSTSGLSMVKILILALFVLILVGGHQISANIIQPSPSFESQDLVYRISPQVNTNQKTIAHQSHRDDPVMLRSNDITDVQANPPGDDKNKVQPEAQIPKTNEVTQSAPIGSVTDDIIDKDKSRGKADQDTFNCK